MDKGYITREYVVWCGCGAWERETSTPLLKTAEGCFKKLGWKKTKKHGWRCPRCIARGKNDAKRADA
jgi:hypothetical protein